MGLHAMSFDRSAIEIDLARRATNAGRLSRLATALMMVVTSIALSGCLEDTPAATASTATGTNTPVAATVENRSSALSGVPATTVAAGEAYRFVPRASDPDGDVLTFSIQNAPSWGTFDTATGVLAGAPAAVNVGTSSSILISVSDGVLVTSLPAFSIQVTSATTPAPTPTGNTPPTVSGVPSTAATVGAAYVFQPSASDADGNTLTFSIASKPAWATFSTSTGQLSGIPAVGDVGAFSGVTISVSDGRTSAALATFSITVTQVATGSATLSWVAPTQNTDGSALTNLSGYRIYYGTSAASLPQSVDIPNVGIQTYMLGNLSPATWYFAVRAVAGGVESDISNVASKTIT